MHFLAHVKQSVLSLSSGTYSRDVLILEKLNECNNMTDLAQFIKHFEGSEECLLCILRV